MHEREWDASWPGQCPECLCKGSHLPLVDSEMAPWNGIRKSMSVLMLEHPVSALNAGARLCHVPLVESYVGEDGWQVCVGARFYMCNV